MTTKTSLGWDLHREFVRAAWVEELNALRTARLRPPARPVVKTMPEPIRLVLECKLCYFERTVTVSGRIKPGMTQERANALVVTECIRAEESFFRHHWNKAHPTEAEEILRHIRAVKRLARLTSYRKRVLSARVEGPRGFRESGSPRPTV